MNCFKAFGAWTILRDFERHVAELHSRVAAPIRFTALGAPVAQRAACVCPGKGEARPNFRNCPPKRARRRRHDDGKSQIVA